jgi:hypothetical protein
MEKKVRAQYEVYDDKRKKGAAEEADRIDLEDLKSLEQKIKSKK